MAAPDLAGLHLGVAFQIVDDMLGIWGGPLVTGKPCTGIRGSGRDGPVPAALDAPAPAAARLARLRASDGASREIAALIGQCGGGSAAVTEARRHMAVAVTAYGLAAAQALAGPSPAARSLMPR